MQSHKLHNNHLQGHLFTQAESTKAPTNHVHTSTA